MSIHDMGEDDDDNVDESTITRLGNWKQPNRPEATTAAAFDKKGETAATI
jgi:hypothetical protein